MSLNLDLSKNLSIFREFKDRGNIEALEGLQSGHSVPPLSGENLCAFG